MDSETPPRPAEQALDFDPVPVRARRDGWTAERQRLFVAALGRTRSVSAACRAVGKSRDTAYALRARPGAGSFAAAWDAAFRSAPPEGARDADTLWHRAVHGVSRPVVHRGKRVGTVVRPDHPALMKLYGRLDRLARHANRGGR